MLLMLAMLLTASKVASLGGNMSPLRLGKAKLLDDLRAHKAFKDKLNPCGDNNIVNINFNYKHYEVLKVDEVEQSVSSIGYMEISWTDSDLTWNKSDYAEVDEISVRNDEVWHPTIFVANAADLDYLKVEQVETITLSSGGIIKYFTPVYTLTSCDMDLKNYPFDVQKCEIMFMSSSEDVQFHFNATSMGGHIDFMITGQWKTISRSIRVDPLLIDHSIEIVSFTFVIERRPMFYVLCIMCPMMLTSSVTSLVFWIPAGSGEKVSFLVTVFAANAVFLNFVAGTMPRNMVSMPRIAAYLVVVNLQCMGAMIATIFVLRMYDKEQEKTRENTQSNNQFEENDNTVQESRKVDNVEVESPTKSNTTSYSTNRRTSRLLMKLSQIQRVTPLGTVRAKNFTRTQPKISRCCLRSSTWDKLFFCAFHLTSCPIYYFIFVM